MPIVIRCKCGKRLKAPDAYAGKRVKCPGCGKGVTVPAPPLEIEEGPMLDFSAQEKEKCPSCSSLMVNGAVVCTSCGFNKESGTQARVKMLMAVAARNDSIKSVIKGEKDTRGFFAAITENLPSAGPVLIFLVAAAVAWGVIEMTKRWSNPPPITSYTFEYVDAYVFSGGVGAADPDAPDPLASKTWVGEVLSGRVKETGTFLVTHPSQSHRFIKLNAKLAKRYFEKKGNTQWNEMHINASEFKLVSADGSEETGMYLNAEWGEPPASVDVEPYPKGFTLPSDQEGLDKWRHPGISEGNLTPVYVYDEEEHEEIYRGLEGTWDFQGESGMHLTVSGGYGVDVTWDEASTGWRAGMEIGDTALGFDTFGDIPTILLFPVPPGGGPYKLKVGTDEITLKESGG